MEYRRTFAELGLATKSLLSHRARAMEKMLAQLVHLLTEDRARRGAAMSQPEATLTPFPLIAKTFSGLENVLAEELTALGAGDTVIGRRMVSFTADQRLLYRANLCCRTAVRLLKPIARFAIDAEAADPYRSLYTGVQAIDWAAYLRAEGTLAIDPVVSGRVLTNSHYASQVAKDAIVDQFRDRFGQRPSVDRLTPQLRINLHVSAGEATVYLDASGQSLHKRGYRRLTGEAPLNEVLAAGILRLTGWNGSAVLIDFLCGSGTIPIEAAMIAREFAPGLLRTDFGYRRWLDFDARLEAELMAELRQTARTAGEASSPHIFASDLDPAMIAAARDNATRANVAGDIQLQIANFENLQPPAATGTIVINPPYDERLKVAGVGAFYRRLGRVLAGAGGDTPPGCWPATPRRPSSLASSRQPAIRCATDRSTAGCSNSSWTARPAELREKPLPSLPSSGRRSRSAHHRPKPCAAD